MHFKTMLCATVLALIPALSFAGQCNRDTHEASTCAVGQVWNEKMQLCIDDKSA